jgi:hypothetical protein
MSHILNDLGEEYALETALEGTSISVGLYHDVNNSVTIGDTSDIGDIEGDTEPSSGNYARQTDTFTLIDNASNNWQAVNTNTISFDVTDTTELVDSYFVVVNFQADDTGDGSATDHLILTGALSQERDLSQIDTLEVNAESLGFSLT